MTERQPIDYVCYCGLYCKLCSMIAITPKLAGSLMESMKKDGWEHYGAYVYEGFNSFWEILQKLSITDKTSTLCRGDCGNPGCEIRVCARGRQVDVCAFCEEYPCRRFDELAKGYPFLMQNNARIREIGLEKWVLEQEELSSQGINHRDLAES